MGRNHEQGPRHDPRGRTRRERTRCGGWGSRALIPVYSRRGAEGAEIAKEGGKIDENAIGTIIVDAALGLHRALGPGLLESVYEVTLAAELRSRGLSAQRQVAVPLVYRGVRFDEGFRVDLLVASKVIVEIKSLENVNDVHKKQLLTYLRLTDKRLGYLLNFGHPLMRSGVFRVVNELSEPE